MDPLDAVLGHNSPPLNTILIGDCRESLRTLPDQSVHCVVTSPPYFGLRDYGTASWEGGDPECDHQQGRPGAGRADGVVDDRGQRNRDGVGSMGGDCPHCGAKRIDSQIGLEPSPQEFVYAMVEVFREIRRVLRDDGTLWLNLGDSYAGSGKGAWTNKTSQKEAYVPDPTSPQSKMAKTWDGIKAKDLIGIPWRVALALQDDGWYLRQDIIWHKPNAMPEPARDRCTKAHEYIFLLTKGPRYFFDHEAIKEPAVRGFAGSTFHEGKTATHQLGRASQKERVEDGLRNRRSVWSVSTKPFKEAHFATYPPELIEPCILDGSPSGGVVLDPFFGAGTTGLVAEKHGRSYIGCELNPEYADIARKRLGIIAADPLDAVLG